MDLGISVICATNKEGLLENIISNFSSQDYELKELVIILNYDLSHINKLHELTISYDNIHIYNLSSENSLGKCLNYGIEISKYPVIAKFDDDDYYGPEYLSETIKGLSIKNVGIVGKACIYIYFTEEKILSIRDTYLENKYVSRVSGSTLMFKRDLFEKIRFEDVNLGEDIRFCFSCIKLGYKILSTNRNHYVYIRNRRDKHTWKMNNNYIMKHCTKLVSTDNFIEYIDNYYNKTK